MTMVVPFSNSAPRTVPGTVTDKETAVPAVVPTVESTVGDSLRWFFGTICDFNLGPGTFVVVCFFVHFFVRGMVCVLRVTYGDEWGGKC